MYPYLILCSQHSSNRPEWRHGCDWQTSSPLLLSEIRKMFLCCIRALLDFIFCLHILGCHCLSVLFVFMPFFNFICVLVYFLVFVFVFFFYIIYFIYTSLCSCFWSAFAQSSPITCASHSCLDWKGNPRPHPIPQTHSCVPDDYDNHYCNHYYHCFFQLCLLSSLL